VLRIKGFAGLSVPASRPDNNRAGGALRQTAHGMPAVLTSVMTTGPTYRLQLKLEQSGAEVEAEMTKTRF
jgi:TOBE-like domain